MRIYPINEVFTRPGSSEQPRLSTVGFCFVRLASPEMFPDTGSAAYVQIDLNLGFQMRMSAHFYNPFSPFYLHELVTFVGRSTQI